MLVDGARVIVLGDFCCGAGDGVWAWISTDGGTTFPTAKRVGQDMWVAEAILGPGNNSVSMVNHTSDPIAFQNGSLSGAAGTRFPIGKDVTPDVNAYQTAGVGLLNSTTPYVVMSTGSKVYLRIFDATKSGYNTAASWLPPSLIDGTATVEDDHPVTAYGTNGAFVGYEDDEFVNGGYRFKVRRINDDGSLGPVMALGKNGANPFEADMTEDASGRVFVAYKDNREDNRLYYQWSKRGLTWSEPLPLSAPNENTGYDAQIAAAPDGGGWVVADSNNLHTRSGCTRSIRRAPPRIRTGRTRRRRAPRQRRRRRPLPPTVPGRGDRRQGRRGQGTHRRLLRRHRQGQAAHDGLGAG